MYSLCFVQSYFNSCLKHDLNISMKVGFYNKIAQVLEFVECFRPLNTESWDQKLKVKGLCNSVDAYL